MRWASFVVWLWVGGCMTPESQPSDTSEDDEMLEMGVIHGVVTQSAELQGDGIGNLIVLAFYATTPATDHAPHNVLVLPYQDFSTPGTEVPYRLENLFPEPVPYTVLAVFDEDDSLLESMSWDPTPGDLLSSALGTNHAPEILIGQDNDCPLNLDLSIIYTE